MKLKLMILLANLYLYLAAKFEIWSCIFYEKSTSMHLKYKTPFGKKVQAHIDKADVIAKSQQKHFKLAEKQRQEEAMKQYDQQERNKIAYMVYSRPPSEKEKKVESKSEKTNGTRNNP